MIFFPFHPIKRSLISGTLIILFSAGIFFTMSKLIQEGFDIWGAIVVGTCTFLLYFLIKFVFINKKVPLCDAKGLYHPAGANTFDTTKLGHIPWEDISHFEKKKIITGVKVVIIHFKDDVKKLEYVMKYPMLQSNMGLLGLDDSCYFMTSPLSIPQHQFYTLLTDFLENGVSFDESIETKIKNIKSPKSPFPWKIGLFTFHWGVLLAISSTLYLSISAVPFLVNGFEVIAEYSSFIATIVAFAVFGFPLYIYHRHFLDPLYQKHCYEDMFAPWAMISFFGAFGIFFLGLMFLPVGESIANSEFDMGIVYYGIPLALIFLGFPYWMILRNKK